MVDPRWGSDEDWDEWSTDRDLCLREVIECKRLSAGPNFVVISLFALLIFVFFVIQIFWCVRVFS